MIQLYRLPCRALVPLDHWHADPVPLVFDLDGTLLARESSKYLWTAAKSSSAKAVPRFCGLNRNAITLSIKDWSLRSVPDLRPPLVDAPFIQGIVDHAAQARGVGRPLWLASGTMLPIAQYMAQRLADEHEVHFDQVFASVWPTNLIGANKARLLQQRAPDGFDYVGDNPSQDRPVWARCRHAYIVAAKGRGIGSDKRPRS